LALGALALGASETGAATTGVTVVATTGAAVFLETDLVVLAGVEAAFIILVAVEEFMAGIRIVNRPLESIFGPLFIFAGVKKFLQ
jgi:hypothetical protein